MEMVTFSHHQSLMAFFSYIPLLLLSIPPLLTEGLDSAGFRASTVVDLDMATLSVTDK
jgi:hypothetical protein